METKRGLLALALVAALCFPAMVMAEGALLKGKPITQEGTIQGLLSACTGQLCVPGEEDIVAAAEDTFVLSVGKDSFYYLPNVSNTLLSRYLGKTVRVKGNLALAGQDSIIVDSIAAVGAEEGKWETIYGAETREKMKERIQKMKKQIPYL